MCGFVTLIQAQGAPDMVLLASMADALTHRGPDGEGTYQKNGVAMHHKRLAIIDIEGGAQPMSDAGVAVVNNGEIYNYVELRDELIALGHPFKTQSDTEVLLRAYLQWGEQCVERLNGMFAFVIDDTRNSRIFAARDPFGIKPLYRAQVGQTLIYASEIKAILCHPQVQRSLDPIGLEDYLSLQLVLDSRTMFTGISKVEPAHTEIYDRQSQRLTTRRYWSPEYGHCGTGVGAAIRQTGELLHASVARQMRSDVPVGAYLSGGLDSSFVTAAAMAHTSQSFETFTGAFHEGPEFDESHFAQAVADHCGAQMNRIYPSDNDFIEMLPKLIYHMDEPAAGPGLFPQFMVSAAASKKVKVCLGGQGGDEIFLGYARYLIGALEESLLGAINDEMVVQGALTLGDVEHCLGTLKTYMPLLKRVWGQGIDAPGHQRYFRVMNRMDASSGLLAPPTRDLLARSQVAQRFEAIFERPRDASHLKKMMHFDMVVNLPTLLQVEDRASMASSLESRVPLLDVDVVQSVAQLPDTSLLTGGFSKSVLRQIAEPILPAKVVSRTDKMGFPVPLQQWVKGSARDTVREILLSQRARERGVFCAEQIEKLIDSELPFGRALWGALQVELWHRTFIDDDNHQSGSASSAAPVHLRSTTDSATEPVNCNEPT